jgi:hypothetical protein
LRATAVSGRFEPAGDGAEMALHVTARCDETSLPPNVLAEVAPEKIADLSPHSRR